MSSYEPPEESEEETSRDAGAQGKEVVDSREFSDVVGGMDRIDYLILAAVLGVPAGLLTVVLVLQFFPEFQDTAGELVRQLLGPI